MCNVSIAKTKLQKLKSRTEKDLYGLKYESMDYLPLTEETFFKVKMVCNSNKLSCPIYKYAGNIRFKNANDTTFTVLHTLAREHNIYLDYTEIS
jgi:hypothetical protein